MSKKDIVSKIDISLSEEQEEEINKKAGITGQTDKFSKLSSPNAEKIEQEDVLNSDDYNKQFNDIENDLSKIFNYSQAVDARIEHNQDLNHESLNEMKDLLKDIRIELKRYETIVYNKEGFDEAVIEEFSNDKNIESYKKNDQLFTDDSLYCSLRNLYNDFKDDVIVEDEHIITTSHNPSRVRNLQVFKDDGSKVNIESRFENKIKLDSSQIHVGGLVILKYEFQREEFSSYNSQLFHQRELLDINNKKNVLTLPALQSITSSNMVSEIEEQLGYNLIREVDKINPINNVLNDDYDSVWSEVIPTPYPFSIQLDKDNIVDNKGFYGANTGALFKIRIIFDSAVPMNEISMSPLSEHPFEIISIRSFPDTKSYLDNNPDVLLSPERVQKSLDVDHLKYVPGVKLSETGIDIKKILERENIDEINFWNIQEIRDLRGIEDDEIRSLEVDKIYDFLLNTNTENPHLVNQYLEDTESFQFNPVECKTLEIAFAQEHYTLDESKRDKEDEEKTKLIQNLFKDKFQHTSIINDENIENTLELDKVNNKNLWLYLKSMFKKIRDGIMIAEGENTLQRLVNSVIENVPRLNSNSFSNIITGSKSNNKDEKKDSGFEQNLKYEYGIKDISPKYNAYLSKGIFVSKPYTFAKNIKQVGIEVDEFNPSENIKEPLTSIEYYVTNRTNPSSDDWYPILPTNHEEINSNKYGEEYRNWVMGERLFAYGGNENHIRLLLRFGGRNFQDSVEIYKNNERVREEDIKLIENSHGIVREIHVFNERYNENNSDIYTINYELNSQSDDYCVDFEEASNPINYIDEEGNPGEKFNSLDHNNSIELSYHPYINKSEVFNDYNFVQEPSQDIDEERYEIYKNNPNIGQYSPNYDEGYIPIRVNIKGEFEVFDKSLGSDGVSVIQEFNAFGIDQDTEGVPFSITRNNKNLTRLKDSPYISNKTNYYKGEIQSPISYDPKEYPVIDYVQSAKNITFAERLDNHEITVEYDYLVESIRVKAIMRRNTQQNSGYTPILYGYNLKVKEF